MNYKTMLQYEDVLVRSLNFSSAQVARLEKLKQTLNWERQYEYVLKYWTEQRDETKIEFDQYQNYKNKNHERNTKLRSEG